MKLFTQSQIAAIENNAVKLGMNETALIESAAYGAALFCMKKVIKMGRGNNKIVVFADGGKKGRIGLAMERLMRTSLADVRIYAAGMDLKPYAIIVDALSGDCAEICEAINKAGKTVVSIGEPCGVNVENGQAKEYALVADFTLALGAYCAELFLFPAAYYTGKVKRLDIYPDSAFDGVGHFASVLDDRGAANLLPARPTRSNKGTFGKVYVMAGCAEMPGAAALSATAAYKCGGGLVKAFAVKHVAETVHVKLTEAVTRIVPDQNGFLCAESFNCVQNELGGANVILLGPGLGDNSGTNEFVRKVIGAAEAPLVLDADALNAVSKDLAVLKRVKRGAVITPHIGEMSRLTGLPIDGILKNTAQTAKDFAARHNVVTVLKDARTIIASPDGRIFINTTGTPALAKAGTGDVLAGMIAAFAAQGADLFTSAALGCFYHGKAGRLAAKKLSAYGVMASDVLSAIPKAIRDTLQTSFN